MSYQTLDTLADLYVPLLFLLMLISVASKLKQPTVALKEFCSILLLAGIAYGMMFADSAQSLWSQRGWDYSTHTATAAACVWYLFWLHKGRRTLGGLFQHKAVYVFWPLSLIAYLALMRYQQYHSWPDMLSTLLAVLPIYCIHYWATR
ncbi:hypothetical protein [Marinagarivorans cellulosilyticus]|uniref:Uncharacterized protein n=1 Tax=Marinagarivorans cellulosilyticus TaxID=2721545 RepID=A0AAN1WL20_9GAMM|nr:hypothetical protein [Marinagarivorans cellulosilyticus]BCD99621.1 hypothetical protein MARGE09_P3823 [Marinagarivorans cellulosilyticus]